MKTSFSKPSSTRLIKKYGNRRLYDMEQSVYITLDDLARRIREGMDVRVVDATTGEDLTQATLTQILIEGRGAAKFLSVPLLTQLVRMGDDALGEFLGKYLSAALDLYLQARRGVQAIAPFAPVAQLPFVATDALSRLLSMAPMWPSAAQGPQATQVPSYHPVQPTPPPPAPVAAQDPAIEELRRELAELRATMSRAPAGRKPAKKR